MGQAATQQRVLTGITTTGIPHLGNYAGAIRPAIQMSQQADTDAFFFLADYHALIKCDEPERIEQSRLQIAATWLAAGLDPNKVTFYRQSDIPEIPELTWILTCLTPKGLMNRAHAYKAMVDQNVEQGAEVDDGVTMGLFSYPILMAADILMFNAHKVPVGRDQIQHLEMARDIAQRFNHHFGRGREYFVLPEAQVDDEVATLPGLDGRKMSKSYNNTIPLFEGAAKDLQRAVAMIQTDSKAPGEPKDPESSHLYAIYRAFASNQESEAFAQQLREGMGWGDAKAVVTDHLEQLLAPMRERYQALMARPQDIEETLLAGADKARQLATPFLEEIRQAVGLRPFVSVTQEAAGEQGVANAVERAGADQGTAQGIAQSAKKGRFVSFKTDDGQFMFRFIDGDGEELLTSVPFSSPRDAGMQIKALQATDADIALSEQPDGGVAVTLNGQAVAYAIGLEANATDSAAWLAQLQQALALLAD